MCYKHTLEHWPSLAKEAMYMTKREFLSEKIGRNLKKFIKASKFKTQERFAFEGMNVNPSTVRRWISGGIKDINTVEEISIVLEINFEELLK